MITAANICLWAFAYGALSWFLFRYMPRRAQTPLPTWLRLLTNTWVIIAIGIGLRMVVCCNLRCQGPLSLVDCICATHFILLPFEVGTILLIGVLARRRGLPSWLTILYAWGPLSVLAWGYGWPAIITTFLLLATICMFGAGERWAWAAYLVLGLAIWTNFAVLLFLPFVVSRRNLKWAVLVLPALIAAYYRVPLGSIVPMEEFVSFRQFLRAVKWTIWGDQMFLSSWFSRDILFCVFLKPDRWLMPISLVLCFVAVGLGWIAVRDCLVTACAALWMWLIVLFPGFGPEHLLPLAALLIFAPQRSWLLVLALMGTVVFGFHNVWLLWCFWLPIAFVSLYDAWRQAKPSGRTQNPPRSLDVIVPTLNEADRLPEFFAALDIAVEQFGATNQVTVIMADGGSDDASANLAAARGIRVVSANQPDRGSQLAEGIAAGDGDVVLMLHADAKIAPDALTRLFQAFEGSPGLTWGILGHVYSERSWRVRLIEFSNRARMHLGGIAFGDQGIFVRRDCLARIGGMPRQRLMEDIELSLRLTGESCRVSLGNCLTLPVGRLAEAGYRAYVAKVQRLSWSYLLRRGLGADIRELSDAMYRDYYDASKTMHQEGAKG